MLSVRFWKVSPCSEISTNVPPYFLLNLATRILESPFENPGYAPDKRCHTQVTSLVLVPSRAMNPLTKGVTHK